MSLTPSRPVLKRVFLTVVRTETETLSPPTMRAHLTPAGPESSLTAFSEMWLDEFRQTSAYEEWAACTDPILFDLYEPRHPCDGPVNAVSDLGLRLTGESAFESHFETRTDC